MGKGQGPQTKVRCSVGHTVKTKLNGMNDLVSHDVSKSVFFVLFVISQSAIILVVGDSIVSVRLRELLVFSLLVKLSLEVKWLQKQEPGNTNQSN